EDVEENLTLACKRCNLAKGTQPYQQFVRFARGAFWNDVIESASDEDLESLLRSYAGTPAGAWFFEVTQEGAPYRVVCRPAGDTSNAGDDYVAEIPRSEERRVGKECRAGWAA